MTQYILRRLLQVIPVFLGTTLLVYFMVFALPGAPIRALFGDRPPSESVIAALRQQYNLDQPFWVQYGLFLKNLFTFNLGVDFTGQPIAATLGRVFPVTAMLAVEALAIQAVFGVAFGLIAGLRKGKIFDSTVLVASLVRPYTSPREKGRVDCSVARPLLREGGHRCAPSLHSR